MFKKARRVFIEWILGAMPRNAASDGLHPSLSKASVHG